MTPCSVIVWLLSASVSFLCFIHSFPFLSFLYFPYSIKMPCTTCKPAPFYHFNVDTSDVKTAITFMLVCKRANIQYHLSRQQQSLLHTAILQKHITPGEYKELFGNDADEGYLLLAKTTAAKKSCLNDRKKHEKNSEAYKLLTERALQLYLEEETIVAFLEKTKRDNPDAICGCSSVSCTETHAE